MTTVFDQLQTRLQTEPHTWLVTPEQWANFNFHLGDICKLADCQNSAQGVDYILHQAALGSVPRCVADPITTNATNVTGFLNMLVAARDAKVERFIYAASSSTYGLQSMGLRYFNVFGPRQDPNGAMPPLSPSGYRA